MPEKGADPDKAERALRWAKQAGIMNWGYFIIGLPGETEETIRQTIDFAKKLPLGYRPIPCCCALSRNTVLL